MRRFKRLFRPLELSMLLPLLALTACAIGTRSAEISSHIQTADAACTAFGPIYFSRLHDTPETIVAVKKHNASFQALCGAGK